MLGASTPSLPSVLPTTPSVEDDIPITEINSPRTDVTIMRDGPARERHISERTLFDALADAQRRAIVTAIAEREEPMSRSSLEERVAETVYEARLDDLADDERRRFRLRMHHLHLPKLDAAGVLRYDPVAQIVEPSDLFAAGDGIAAVLPK
jgi:hypothetical protein